MAFNIKHDKNISKPDGPDTNLLQPSHWNAAHKILMPAQTLIGRSAEASDGDAEAIAIGAGLELTTDPAMLSVKSNALETVDFVVGTAITPIDSVPNHRVMTDTSSIVWNTLTAGEIKGSIPDEGVRLVMMVKGAQGATLYYRSDGFAAQLPPGIDGQSLITKGPDANPVWGFCGAPHAVLQGQKPSGLGQTEGAFAAGSWKTRLLATEVYDLFDLVEVQGQGDPLLGTNRFRFAAGTYVVEWSCPAFSVHNHQSRLFNVTAPGTVLGYGSSEFSHQESSNDATQTRSVGIAKFTIAAGNTCELQHQCSATTSQANGLGISNDYGTGNSNIFSQMKIWRVG